MAATLGAVRQVGRSIRAQAPFLVLTTAAACVPPAGLVAFADGLNDKPGGFHADAWAYAKVVLVAALGAGLAAVV